ncbi:hypothetical protein K469DRAFT_318544 [Zopfia rhizophila CBS 207.26]|uniref:Uncharacterized protein n=1 Tax=Zopfia rhizophila CBS 207.26 TaxID=1314779 RepID=A0A6A6EMH0_9PEZI|nr:hypothetical protein K469DRAFT_318544 [Zopfia rhizophila CBS 207.26]
MQGLETWSNSQWRNGHPQTMEPWTCEELFAYGDGTCLSPTVAIVLWVHIFLIAKQKFPHATGKEICTSLSYRSAEATTSYMIPAWMTRTLLHVPVDNQARLRHHLKRRDGVAEDMGHCEFPPSNLSSIAPLLHHHEGDTALLCDITTSLDSNPSEHQCTFCVIVDPPLFDGPASCILKDPDRLSLSIEPFPQPTIQTHELGRSARNRAIGLIAQFSCQLLGEPLLCHHSSASCHHWATKRVNDSA